MVSDHQPRLFRLAQVAQMLQVHPKTVYYWVRTGRLNALTSPGGLLRVRAEDARALCESSGMPVPADLATVRRRVYILEGDKSVAKSLARSLKAKGFDVRTFDDPYEALIATVKEPPEALVVDSKVGGMEIERAVAALGRDESTKRTRILAWDDVSASEGARLSEAGVEEVLPRGDTAALAKALNSNG